MFSFVIHDGFSASTHISNKERQNIKYDFSEATSHYPMEKNVQAVLNIFFRCNLFSWKQNSDSK